MGPESTELAEKEVSQANSFGKRLRRRIGFIIALIGSATVLFTYVANVSGLMATVWSSGSLGYGVFLPILGLPILALGFLLCPDWKKHLSFTEEKVIVLTAFVLFFPSPWISLGLGGYTPPVFVLLVGIFGFFYMGYFALISLLIFGALLCFGHILASFLCTYIKNIFFPWIILAALAIMSLFPIYCWGDIGGGSGVGNIFTCFREFFIG